MIINDNKTSFKKIRKCEEDYLFTLSIIIKLYLFYVCMSMWIYLSSSTSISKCYATRDSPNDLQFLRILFNLNLKDMC